MPTINKPTDSTLATGLENIATAIDGFFRLIPENVTVNNGSFSLKYKGAPPNINTASIISNYEATSQTGLSYSVSYNNGTATFTLVGTVDGVITGQTNAVVTIGETSVVVGMTGLPVNYEPRLIQAEQSISVDDTTTPKVVDVADFIKPSGVSPSAIGNLVIEPYVTIYDETTDTITQIDCTVSGTNVTIPVDGLVEGAQLNLWLKDGFDVVSTAIAFLSIF